MAWTTPMTATTNQTFTAAQWNTHVRDNFLETEVGIATTRGRLIVSDGANSLREGKFFQGINTTTQSTTSTSYTDLATAGPSVGVNTGTSAIVWFMVGQSNSTGAAWCSTSVSVSGATTVAASDDWAFITDGLDAGSSTDDIVRGGSMHRFTGLTAGFNTFKMQYRVGSGTGFFSARALQVFSL